MAKPSNKPPQPQPGRRSRAILGIVVGGAMNLAGLWLITGSYSHHSGQLMAGIVLAVAGLGILLVSATRGDRRRNHNGNGQQRTA